MAELKDLKALKTSYKKTFETEDGKKVLQDLQRRCFAKQSTFVVDPFLMAFNGGTRSVLLYIESMMDMSNIKDIEKGEENVTRSESGE